MGFTLNGNSDCSIRRWQRLHLNRTAIVIPMSTLLATSSSRHPIPCINSMFACSKPNFSRLLELWPVLKSLTRPCVSGQTYAPRSLFLTCLRQDLNLGQIASQCWVPQAGYPTPSLGREMGMMMRARGLQAIVSVSGRWTGCYVSVLVSNFY